MTLLNSIVLIVAIDLALVASLPTSAMASDQSVGVNGSEVVARTIPADCWENGIKPDGP